MAARNDRNIQERERTTTDEAREQGIGEPAEGTELTAPSYTDDHGTSYSGVDEPIVPEPLRGDESARDGDTEES